MIFNFKLRKEKLPAIFAMKRVYQLISWPGLFAPLRGAQGKKSVLDNP